MKKTATEVSDPSAANDEGITALHNAICAGHWEIVKFLVLFGCDVNAQVGDYVIFVHNPRGKLGQTKTTTERQSGKKKSSTTIIIFHFLFCLMALYIILLNQ